MPSIAVDPLVRARGARSGPAHACAAAAALHGGAVGAVDRLGAALHRRCRNDRGEPAEPAGRPRVGRRLSAPRRGSRSTAASAYSQARFTDGAPEGDRIPGAIEGVASAGVTVTPRRRWSGSLRYRFFGPRPLVEDNSVRSRASTSSAPKPAMQLNRVWRLKADLLNLFDSKSSDIDYFYTSRLPGEAAGRRRRPPLPSGGAVHAAIRAGRELLRARHGTGGEASWYNCRDASSREGSAHAPRDRTPPCRLPGHRRARQLRHRARLLVHLRHPRRSHAHPLTYGRFHNPTWTAWEAALSELEGGEAVAFASGMAAISAILGTTLSPGDVVVLPSDCYYTVRVVAGNWLAKIGVTVRQAPTAGNAQRERARRRATAVARDAVEPASRRLRHPRAGRSRARRAAC